MRLGVRGAPESRPQVLAQIAAEERGHPVAAVLANVGELVREELDRSSGRDRALRANRQKDAPAEDDRIGAGEGRQNPGETPAMETCPRDLGGETGAKALGESGRDPVSAERVRSRRGSFGATRSASNRRCR